MTNCHAFPYFCLPIKSSDMQDLLMNKVHDEKRQGEAIAPVKDDQHLYQKSFT